MPVPNRSHLSAIRGAARLAFDATEAITGVVEKMHRTIQLRPGPLGKSAADRTSGITGFVYRCVRGGVRLTGRVIDTGLAPVTALLPDGESSAGQDAWRAVANGVYGDHLVRTGNPLAINMSLHHSNQRVDLAEPSSTIDRDGGATPPQNKLLVLVHGLCMNDRQWQRDGHDHGAALADDLGYLPLYLRYNSGLPVASNGRELAKLLETLVDNWTQPVEELAIIGHSMGGLLARSACYYGHAAGHVWPQLLRKIVFLGTPHHGAVLERGGHGLDLLMDLSPYSKPFTRLSRARSAGITDLRQGTLADGEENVPLPADVKCYAVAAMRGTKRSVLSERLVGDGLVPLNSALGRHRDTKRTLAIPRKRQWIGYQIGHLELLNHPDVYARVHRWLQ